MASVPTERPHARGRLQLPASLWSTGRRPSPAGPPGSRTQWLATLAIAGLICFVAFFAKGGLSLEPMTTSEMVLTLGSGFAIAAAAIAGAGDRYGMWSLGLLVALTVLTALSVVWSVQPDASWLDAGRMLAYSGVFAAAIVLVRLAPRQWSAVLGGVTLAAVVVCGYALLTKVFPGSLAKSDTYARIEQPYGYWNATGLTAAMGAIGCMWLGARRRGHALLSAMAYPALGILLLTLLMAYSRGALGALAIGLIAWFCIVPLRLRGAAVLIVAAVVAGAVAAWTFSVHALSSDNVALADRTAAGHRFGALLLAMVLLLAAVGVAVGFLTGRRAPSQTARRRAGAVLLATIVVALIAFAGALAHSHRGFTGTISHDVSSLTNPNAKTPPNTPGRLTAVASVRARYWKEALEVFGAHPALGAGAMGYQTARLRYRTAPLVVAHAHGFLAQTLADLGLVGLLLVLALLGCWAAAAGRATHPFNRSWTPWRAWLSLRSETAVRPGWRARPEAFGAERVGLLSMLCIVIAFGVHSLVDWTWYVPATACMALLCAGWLAGRGPLDAPSPARAWPRSFAQIGRTRLLVAGAAIAAALLAAWSQWQPLRAEDARQQALEQLASHPAAALASARTAVDRDPLSPLALITLAEVQRASGQTGLARATLQRAVREQPSNPQTWLALGRYDLQSDPQDALRELQAAIYLDPESISPELLQPPRADREAIEIYNDYVVALRAVKAAAARQSRSARARH